MMAQIEKINAGDPCYDQLLNGEENANTGRAHPGGIRMKHLEWEYNLSDEIYSSLLVEDTQRYFDHLMEKYLRNS